MLQWSFGCTGSFDPITPPAYGRLAGETLSNSYQVEVRNSGHGVPIDACTWQIMRDFIAEPYIPPDTTCNALREPVRFLTGVHLNGGIYRVATAVRSGPSAITLVWLSVTLLIPLAVLVVWPLSWLRRRVRKLPPGTPGLARAALWVAGVAAVAAVGFLAVLVWTVLRTSKTNPLILAFGVPDSAAPLFLVPWLMLLSGLGVLMFAVAAWRHGWWNVAMRIHYTLVGAACVGFVGFLAYWRLF